jgi:hypothetical protein
MDGVGATLSAKSFIDQRELQWIKRRVPLDWRMDQNWTDKIVIVTGGGGGMGQAAAKRFAQAGAKTFVFGRTLESLQESAALSPNITPVVVRRLPVGFNSRRQSGIARTWILATPTPGSSCSR